MDFMNFIIQEALILIPVLWIIGMALKNFKKIADEYIPVILIALGILGSLGLLGVSVSSAIQGVLVGGAAIGINQVKKQIDKME